MKSHLFLDIYGVLNCTSTPNPRKFPYIVDPSSLSGSSDLFSAQEPTWRYDPAGLFSAKHCGIPFMDVIPDMPKRPRRDEVLAWLKTHPKVKRFVVIDDEDDELDQLPLFQPSASTGLTEKIANGVANYLVRKTDEDMRCNAVVRALQSINPRSKDTRGRHFITRARLSRHR